ncbi:MAG: YdcF family protein [Chloroflexota bacterium]
MFLFLSKFLPLLVYPIGLTSILIILALVLHKRHRWQRTLLIFALTILWLGGNRWVAFSLVRSLEWRYLPPTEIPAAEAIVVLGGGTEASLAPRSTVEVNGAGDRVLYAAWLYHQGKAPHLLLTGGRLEWNQLETTPAEEMAALLQMLNVPEEALWLEPDSRNTYENAVYCQDVLEKEGIHKIILVTSAMHMPRSVGLFEKQGLEVIPAPTDFTVTEQSWQSLTEFNLPKNLLNLLPSVSNLELTTQTLKEYLGMLIYRLRGWL